MPATISTSGVRITSASWPVGLNRSTVERFAEALGYAIEYHLVPAGKSMRRQGIVVES